MTFAELRAKLLEDSKWAEKAIVALDDGNYWTKEDARTGKYLANWIRTNKNPLGQRISGDRWEGTSRGLVIRYVDELLVIAYQNSQQKKAQLEKEHRQLQASLASLVERIEDHGEKMADHEQEMEELGEEIERRQVQIQGEEDERMAG